MSNESNPREPANGQGQTVNKRFGLLLVAVAFIGVGVFARSLPLVAVGLLLATAAFYLLPESTSMPVVPAYAFLAGGALFLAVFTGLLTDRDVNNPFIPLLWTSAMVLGLVAAVKLDRSLPQTAEGSRRSGVTFRSYLLLIPIILLAFALRIHDLESYPPLHGDEGEMGLAALRVISGESPPPTAAGWLDHPALFHYLQAVPLALFGQTGFALRLLSVFVGLWCVPLVYAVGRRWWGPIAGLSAASLLAVAHLHVQFSRLGLNNIESTFFLLLFLLLMTRVRPRRVTIYILAGLVAGLAQYMYYGSRVILLIAAGLLFLAWRKRIAGSRQLAAFAIGVALAILPLLVFYLNQPDSMVNRARGVLVFSGDNVKHVLGSDQASLPQDLLPMFGQQLRSNLSFFIADGDRSPFYTADVPGLDLVTSVLFWLGLGLALTRLSRLPEFTVLLCLGLTVLIGGVLTIDAPNAPRLQIALPAIVLLAGLVLQRGDQLLVTYPRRVRALSLTIILLIVAVLNIKIYYGDFASSLAGRNVSSDLMAREIRAAGDSFQIYLLGQPNLYANYGTIQFLGSDEVEDITTADDIQLPAGKGLLVLALPNHIAALEDIKQRWPGGESFSRATDQDILLFSGYRVPAG